MTTPARNVRDYCCLDRGYRNLAWPYHALNESDLHPDGGSGTQCPRCAIQLCRCRAQQYRPGASRELLAAAVTRRQVARRVVELVLALVEDLPTLSPAQRRELRTLAARVRPG